MNKTEIFQPEQVRAQSVHIIPMNTALGGRFFDSVHRPGLPLRCACGILLFAFCRFVESRGQVPAGSVGQRGLRGGLQVQRVSVHCFCLGLSAACLVAQNLQKAVHSGPLDGSKSRARVIETYLQLHYCVSIICHMNMSHRKGSVWCCSVCGSSAYCCCVVRSLSECAIVSASGVIVSYIATSKKNSEEVKKVLAIRWFEYLSCCHPCITTGYHI